MTSDPPIPTQAERDFCFHFYQEESRHNYQGPAHRWINEHGIPHNSVIAFGYWEQRNNPAWLNQILEDEPPAFRVPWSSPEEFFERVRLLLELYPDVRDITPDRPKTRHSHREAVSTTKDPLG
jgi:hypothetical protein